MNTTNFLSMSLKCKKQRKILQLLTLSWRSRYHTETSPLICGANQWTGFYMITISIIKGLRNQNEHTTIFFELFFKN